MSESPEKETVCQHILIGGPIHRISVDGKIYTFEMHRYCGPVCLDEEGEGKNDQPIKFLMAASLWAQQGQEIDQDGLCIWYHERKPIIETRENRRFIVGYEPRVKGC